MSFDAVFSGTPLPQYPASAATVSLGVDKTTGALWTTATGGWAPVSSAARKAVALGVTGVQASLISYVAPTTGLYRIDGYEARATATANTTTPAITVSYTEGDTSATITAQSVVAAGATTTLGQSTAGSAIINVKAGTTVTVASAAVTGGSANIKVRIEFLG